MKSRALERLILVTAMGLQPVLAAAQQAELEEVIVTAERREASLQSTPIAVSAVGSEDLERLQITSIKDLDTAVPSMTIETNVASNTSITISMRGNAEQNAAFLFSEPGVGLYLNGVYRRLSGSNIELLDIERIEVLRGPQGTLFGRNTLAGAINVVTRAPSDEFTGSLQLGYGQFDTTRARIAVSGPISGGWSGSASVMRTERAKGWATNLVDNTKLGTNEFLGGTGSLAYEGDKVKALITVYASNAESDGPFGNPVSVATKARLFSDEGFVASAPITVGGRKLMPFNDTDQHGADVVLTFPLGDWTLKSTTAYSKMLDDWAVDFTAGQLGAAGASRGTSGFFRMALSDQDQLSQEFNLNYSSDRLQAIGGVFYYTETSNQEIRDWFAGGLFAGVPARHKLDSDSWALYAQVNYKLNDRWSVLAGGRYNDDQKKFSGNKAGATGAPVNFSSDRSFTRFSGKAGVEFKISDDLFSYLTFSQGYKAGTYDPFANGNIIAQGLNPETVDSLEAGLKAELLNRTLRLNNALYMVRYKDLAIGTITSTGLELKNAGETEVKGLESELTWLATDNFRVFATLGLMDGKWKSLAATALLTGVKLSDDPPFTFKTQGSLGATFEMPVAPGKLSFTVTGRHMDHYFQQVAHLNNPLDRVDARNWVDAGATFESKDGAHKLALNVKNVTDEQGQYSALNFSTFLFNNTASWLPGEPRMWELNYSYSFK